MSSNVAAGQPAKRIAILDTDVMVPAVQPVYGKYYSSQYIKHFQAAANRIGLHQSPEYSTWDVLAGSYPDPATVDAIVITGSIAAAYDTDPWVLELAAFIDKVYTQHPTVRIFGTCFGHQLIGQVLLGPHGAVVEKDPNGYEFGVRNVALNPKLIEDFPCLEQLRQPGTATHGIRLQMCHGDHVALPKPPGRLPGNWVNIGGSAHCQVQGLYEPARVLTIQPHFECDQFIMEATIRHFYTPKNGFQPRFLEDAFQGTRKDDDAGLAAEWVLRFLLLL
ncbi:putative glutamine amidotransferase-like protein [Colletotrichum spinosum]|uniref:Putative glutamine amidotransferase-like protein n=1 Tax=Colletotrichum spinosum TaxID=1347390 RepID=A0A4R8Q4U6_9PEZI|nr:putative glutamine amidotransferase-like protein [Colletotrichum spinosum]